jgi:hypothetical protein
MINCVEDDTLLFSVSGSVSLINGFSATWADDGTKKNNNVKRKKYFLRK